MKSSHGLLFPDATWQ